jgi:cAMP-binding proteins - catabolite gene activator and regulatory subunit of cAMP-dependent protein kinases
MALSTDQLKQVPLFSGLGDKDLKSIAATMRERTFKAGESATQEGQSGVGFFVIESGQASVDVGGREVRKLGPGDYFGEVALLAQAPRSATITAETDLLCWGLTPWDFKPLVERNASIAWVLLQTLAQRLSEQG